jgi:hypothetical protein
MASRLQPQARMKHGCVTAIGLAVAACTGAGDGPARPSELSELSDVIVNVQVGSAQIGINTVTVFHDDVLTAFPDDCPVLDESFGGSFGGQPLVVKDRGGKGESECRPLELEIASDQVFASSQIELRDGTFAISATFSADAIVTRTATLRSHTAWSFAAGETVTLDWSPASDLAGATPVILLDGESFPTTVAGGELSFVVPSSSARKLIIDVGQAVGEPATECVNARTCVIGQARYSHHDVEIGP